MNDLIKLEFILLTYTMFTYQSHKQNDVIQKSNAHLN